MNWVTEHETYQDARAHAQAWANKSGLDIGLSKPTEYQAWTLRMLPKPENRFGSELRCEVVRPE